MIQKLNKLKKFMTELHFAAKARIITTLGAEIVFLEWKSWDILPFFSMKEGSELIA